MGFIHRCNDYLGLLCSRDVYVCISRGGSSFSHNSMDLSGEGLHCRDYSPSPSASVALPFISAPVAADHRHEHSRRPSRLPQEIW